MSAPGEITENGAVFTIVAGPWRPEPQAIYEKLAELKGELEESRIQFEISKDIRSDAFEKFSMVSPFAAAGTYLHIAAGDYEKNPAHMQLFRALVGEVRDVALAMGLSMREDIVEKNVSCLLYTSQKAGNHQLPHPEAGEGRPVLRADFRDVYKRQGMRLNEPALDLAIAASIVSSFRNKAIGRESVFLGELGLTGELRHISQAEKRLTEARHMGLRRAVLPYSNMKGLRAPEGMELQGVKTLSDALGVLFE